MFELIHFFRKRYPEYIALPLHEIPKNAASLGLADRRIDVVFFHLLYDPQIIGIQISDALAKGNPSDIHQIEIPISLSRNMTLEIEYLHQVAKNTVFLFKVRSADVKPDTLQKLYISRFVRRSLHRKKYLVSVFDRKVFEKILAFFFYPKPVFLIATGAGADHAFPVDTCREVGDYFIFGVRNSNAQMKSKNTGDHLGICLSDYNRRDAAYQLGNYNAGTAKVGSVTENQYGIQIPMVVSAYTITTICEIYRFGPQDIYVAKKITDSKKVNDAAALAHIHKYWMVAQKRRREYGLLP